MARVLTGSDLRCPLSGKAAYPTEEKANRAIEIAHNSPTWENHHGGRLPVRAYLCECGWWHMTSRPLRRP